MIIWLAHIQKVEIHFKINFVGIIFFKNGEVNSDNLYKIKQYPSNKNFMRLGI